MMASEMVMALLKFPDRVRSCRDFHWGGGCTRKKCKLIRDGEESSLLALVKSLDEAEKTMDVAVATITCEELADAVLTNEFTTNGITPQVRSFMDAWIPVRDHPSDLTFTILDQSIVTHGSFDWIHGVVMTYIDNVMILSSPSLTASFQE